MPQNSEMSSSAKCLMFSLCYQTKKLCIIFVYSVFLAFKIICV